MIRNGVAEPKAQHLVFEGTRWVSSRNDHPRTRKAGAGSLDTRHTAVFPMSDCPIVHGGGRRLFERLNAKRPLPKPRSLNDPVGREYYHR
jgi:hypothetical protein